MEFTVSFPEGWEDNPFSLRKRYLDEKLKGVKQQLISRYDEPEDVIRTIKKHIRKEENNN
ncbi:MAG: hypothetical protein ACOC1K_01380 [Nanoarchaeota archaeon]